MERINVIDNKRIRRVSWGSIIGGVVTVLAVSFLLSLIGTSISLFMLDPLDNDPFAGVGTSFGIWTVISILISLAAGGFVAGKLAANDGIIHGFLTWASSLIVAIILGSMLASSAIKITGNILGSISSITGNILSELTSSDNDDSSNASSLLESLGIDFNGEEIRQETRQMLRQTGVRELQPNYIQNQISAVNSDLQRSAKQLALNPKNAENIINGFTNRLQNRIDRYASSINREDLVTAVSNTANVSREQAESTVNQYMELIEQGREQLNNLQNSIQEAKQEWEQMKQEALQKTEEVANSAAWTAIWSFLALLVGAAICSFAGQYGVRINRRGYEV